MSASPSLAISAVVRKRERLSAAVALLVALALFAPLAWEAGEHELSSWDVAAARWVDGVNVLPLDYLMQLFTVVGGGPGLRLGVALALLVLFLRRRRREAVFLGASVWGAALIARVLKDAFARPRPGLADAHDRAFLSVGTRELLIVASVLAALTLLTRWRRYALLIAGAFALSVAVTRFLDSAASPDSGLDSFPSGHATGSAALAAAAVVLAPRGRRRAAILLASGFVLGVGLSRLYFGVHYPSDVLAGWAVGVAWVAGLRLLLSTAALAPLLTGSRRPSDAGGPPLSSPSQTPGLRSVSDRQP